MKKGKEKDRPEVRQHQDGPKLNNQDHIIKKAARENNCLMATTLGEAAQEYASIGLKVIPLHSVRKDGSCSCDNGADCNRKGKHPRINNWRKRATTDQKAVCQWWSKWPDSNIGVCAGELVVLDIDVPHGESSLEKMQRDYGKLPESPEVITGSGGRHLYFRGHGIRNMQNLASYPGVDLKGEGGYVVAPPSNHSGGIYQWKNREGLTDLAELPAWIGSLVSNQNDSVGAMSLNKAEGRTVSEVELLDIALKRVMEDNFGRNDSGFWLACQLRDNGFPLEKAEEVILSYCEKVPATNTKGTKEPYSRGAALASLEQAFRVPARDPWSCTSEWSKLSNITNNVNSGNRYEMLSCKQLNELQTPEQRFIVDRVISRGGLHILSAMPKEGKSTLAAAMIGKINNKAPFLGLQTHKAKVGWFAFQEQPVDVKERFQRFEVDDVWSYIGSSKAVKDPLKGLEEAISEHGLELVVIDTLANFWRIHDENNSVDVEIALQQLREIARSKDCAILLIHHNRKSPGTHGSNIRGSGTILGEVDNALILQRRAGREQERSLEAVGRWGEIHKAIKLDNNEYVLLENASRSKYCESQSQILELLENENPLTEKGIKEHFELQNQKISQSTIKRYLKSLIEQKEVLKKGKGVAGDPYLYYPVSTLLTDPASVFNPSSNN